MNKRLIAVFLMICMLASLCVYAEETNETEAQTSGTQYEVLWDEDFDSTDKAHTNFSRTEFNIEIDKYDDEHGKSAKIEVKSGTWPAFIKTFDKPVSSGIVYIAYDMLKTGSVGRTYDAFLKDNYSSWGNGMYIGTMWQGSGSISWYNDCHIDAIKTALPAGMIPQAAAWHKIESWLDFDNRIATYYVDGEKLGETTITEEFTQMSAYRRATQPEYGLDTQYYDNYKIIHISNIKEEVRIDGASVPEYLKSPISINATTEELGNTYFDDTAKIKTECKNIYSSDVSGQLKVKVFDDSGKAVFDNSTEISIKPYEVQTKEYEFKMESYGYYYAEFEFVAEGYNTGTKECVIAHLRESEKQNEELGVSAHSYWGYGTDEIERKQNMFKRAGFKMQRETFFWVYYEKEKGVYEFDELYRRIVDSCEQNNITPMVIISASAVRSEWTNDRVPSDEKSLKNFYDYVYHLVSDLKGKVKYYEVFNELQLSTDKAPQYVGAQKAAYEAVKAADPEAKVLCGATARVPEDWINSLLDAGAGNYFDGFSCHPYTVENVPEEGRKQEGTAEDMVLLLRSMLDKHGLSDKEIVLTELSYSSGAGYATDMQQAAYGLRQYFMVLPHISTFIWYNDQNKSGASDLESNFGLIENWQDADYPYQAKPVLLAFSAYNSLLADGKVMGKQKTADEKIWIYQFKTGDDEDVIALWNAKNERYSVTLDLGCESVDVYDMYGNSSKLYADDGKFNIDAIENITYLKGGFTKVEQDKGKYNINDNKLDVIRGEEFEISYSIPQDEEYEIKAVCSDNIVAESITSTGAKFSAGTNGRDDEKLEIEVYKSGRLVYTHKIDITYVEPITYTMSVQPYNTQRYQAEIKLKNMRKVDVAAKLTLTSPSSLAGKTYSINTINPGNERTIRLNIPIETANTNALEITGVINSEGGGKISETPFSATKEIGCLKYGDKKPEIDGVISPGEWYEFLPMKINKKSMAQQKDWQGEDDLSANVYTMCDDENFYLGVEVTDDVLYDKDTPERVWANDSVQFAIALRRENGSPSTEIGFGLSNGEPTLQCYITQAIDGGKATDSGTSFSDKTKYAVKRYEEEKKTVYELCLPWDEIYAEPIKVKNLKEIYFSILVNDDDGNGRGWLEYCGGIGTNKNPELFMTLPIYIVK